MFFYEICEIFKNTYFEDHLQTTAALLTMFLHVFLVNICVTYLIFLTFVFNFCLCLLWYSLLNSVIFLLIKRGSSFACTNGKWSWIFLKPGSLEAAVHRVSMKKFFKFLRQHLWWKPESWKTTRGIKGLKLVALNFSGPQLSA